jgi:hypothetical protein
MLGLAIDLFRYPYQKDYSYDRHKDVIKKLKFISKIEPGERINVSTVSTTSHNLFSSIYRSIFKESRVKTFQFLNDVVDRSFELIVLYQDSTKISDRITCSQILEDLISTITGLKNLQTTYADDRNFYCDIDTLIGSIFARLAEFTENDTVYIIPETREKLLKIIPINRMEPVKKEPVKKESFEEKEPIKKEPIEEKEPIKKEEKEPVKKEEKESVKKDEEPARRSIEPARYRLEKKDEEIEEHVEKKIPYKKDRSQHV